jgi:hypothetical protein
MCKTCKKHTGPKKKRKAGAYALFVKKNYPRLKKANPSAGIGTIGKLIAKEWHAQKPKKEEK